MQILSFSSHSGLPPYGAGDVNYFEPLLGEVLIHFNKLMEVYQVNDEEN